LGRRDPHAPKIRQKWHAKRNLQETGCTAFLNYKAGDRRAGKGAS
jgi:hypothetical protein